MRNSLRLGKYHITALSQSLTQIMGGIVYLPLLFRPKRRSYSAEELLAMVSQFAGGCVQIEEDPVYQDFIVHGHKSEKGGSNVC